MGMRGKRASPSFPILVPATARLTRGGNRRMIRRLLTCLIALGALAACGGGSTPSGGASPGGAQTISFKETEYSIAPASTTLKPGTYTFDVQNVGQFPHDLHIAASDGSELGATSVLKTNGTASMK